MSTLTLNVQDLAATARAEGRTLRLETCSGTVYHLKPVPGHLKFWDVVRMPADPNGWSIHPGVGVYHRGSDLFIGSWHTTGLAKIQLV